ncbi:MAG: hypothetical protein J6M90_02145 [Oscillospiraceae bacterium]|jgi:hypothetical protein|nr:hypothetical protein [Oscillospiraceae bacterium]MBQ4256854.1 hypothetical protein [Oscillospiraceae bacterium]MBR4345678.1 hypothetical protein [Oscillospiraceae bacterium]
MEDRSYLEYELPELLKDSIEKMKKTWERLDAGIPDMAWDGDYCELQSNINICEVAQLISSEQAWYLREKYLRMEKDQEI